ncbi:MAG TPA: low molecular weight protein-tyrosine-phosphatase [Acidimicrobiales bacterium]
MASNPGRGARPTRVLFVCWGNICRSPTAEAVLRAALEREGLAHLIEVDSAGVSDEHAGDPPDRRAVAAAARRGLDLGGRRARVVRPDDFERFDLMLVSDALVERVLRSAAPESRRSGIRRMTDFVAGDDAPHEVPDPYYGGADGFAAVLDLLERACAGLIEHLGSDLDRADGAPPR